MKSTSYSGLVNYSAIEDLTDKLSYVEMYKRLSSETRKAIRAIKKNDKRAQRWLRMDEIIESFFQMTMDED